jgi:hypothetical protein
MPKKYKVLPPEFTTERFLAMFPAPIQVLSRALRTVILEAMPGAQERVNPGWRSIAYHHSEHGYVCGVFPFQDDVKLIFEYGAFLTDPSRVLRGNGQQVRFIEIQPGDELPRDTIAALVDESLALPLPLVRGQLRQGARQRKGAAPRA